MEFLLKFSNRIAVKDEPVQEIMKRINDQKTYLTAKPALVAQLTENLTLLLII